MRARRAMAALASSVVLASCSLVTTWDGLTTGGSGGADAGTTSGAPDAGPDAPTHVVDAAADAAACKVTGLYCGGDDVNGDPNTLYHCNGAAAPTVAEVCKYGCIVRSAGEDDTCRCTPGGAYCGGDKVEGNPDTLYRCQTNGTGTVIEHCTNGCKVVPNDDDVCG